MPFYKDIPRISKQQPKQTTQTPLVDFFFYLAQDP